jgi:hypothetical protein
MDDPIAVLERLLDSSKWPTYRSLQHSKLWELARDAYDRQTFDGYASETLRGMRIHQGLRHETKASATAPQEREATSWTA